MYSNFDYRRIVAVNFRWMRYQAESNLTCRVNSVEALKETGSSVANPRLRIGSSELTIPGTLKTGDYAEYRADGAVKFFDRNGMPLAVTGQAKGAPTLRHGENRIVFSADSPASIELTTILRGDVLSF